MASDASASSRKNLLSEIAERVVNGFVKQQAKEPAVRASVIEKYAKRMMAAGYDMNADSLVILVDYLKGYNLWLCGNVGTGKTYFFDCINKVRKDLNYERIVKLSMLDTQAWNMDMAREWASDYKDDDVLIDDVGVEPKMRSWGQEAELFPYLLEKRLRSKKRTHLTSNLGIVDIKNRYGERVSDRFVQMFKMEQMKARKSKRKLRPWKTATEEGMVFL